MRVHFYSKFMRSSFSITIHEKSLFYWKSWSPFFYDKFMRVPFLRENSWGSFIENLWRVLFYVQFMMSPFLYDKFIRVPFCITNSWGVPLWVKIHEGSLFLLQIHQGPFLWSDSLNFLEVKLLHLYCYWNHVRRLFYYPIWYSIFFLFLWMGVFLVKILFGMMIVV